MHCKIAKCLQPLTLRHSAYIFVIMFFSKASKPLPYRCPYLLLLCSSVVHSVMFQAKHKHTAALYKIHYTIYLCPFCNNFIRSCHMNFHSPNNRKGPSSFLMHLYRLWGPSTLPCDGEMGAILLGIKQLQHEVVVVEVVVVVVVVVLKSTMSAAVPLLPLHAFMLNMGATAAFTLNPNNYTLFTLQLCVMLSYTLFRQFVQPLTPSPNTAELKALTPA